MRQKLERSIQELLAWVEARNYRGHEPADGNSSPLHALTFGHAFPQRLLQQAVLRAPINIRPLLGIRPLESPQARGYLAAGYVTMFQLTGEPRYQERATTCLDWLMQNKSPGYAEYSWGNNFSYATRSGRLPKLEPIVPWTALNGFAFLDAYEAFGDPRHLRVASSVCDWILKLPREHSLSGSCISYHAFRQTSLHNSNLLAAALLARTAKLQNDTKGLDVAKAAVQYSCTRQLPSGAWLYGEADKYRWIDNFHTGYNLDSLKCYLESTGDRAYEDCLRLGFGFFKYNFFEDDGRPKYYFDKTYPIDIQCAAQAIETLALFAEDDPEALDLALKVAAWSIDHMQDADGHFYYRQLSWTKVKTPLLHWGQGTMFKALARLLTKVEKRAQSAPRTGPALPAHSS